MQLRFYIIAILIFNWSGLKSQTVQFELKIINPCDRTVKTFNSYRLKKDTVEFFPDYQTGICTLLPGDYQLSYIMEDVNIDKNKIYHFRESGYYCDTLIKNKINKCMELTSRPSFFGYCCCDTICNGYNVDYYKNGEKRIEGNFINGKPVGKLIFYNKNGRISYVEKYSKKGKLRKTINY
jgi:hypothetical protein